MTIYPKILFTVLPFLFFALAGAIGTTYYFSYDALQHIADNWLKIRLGDVIEVADEQIDMLEKYRLGFIPASVRKAQADAAVLMQNLQIGMKGEVMAVDNRGVVQAHPEQSLLGDNVRATKWYQEMTDNKSGHLFLQIDTEDHYARYRYFEPWDWYILVVVPKSELYGQLETTKKYILSIGVIAALCLALALMLVTRRLTDPLRQLTRSVTRVGEEGPVPFIPVKTRDESGELAKVFNEMTQRLSETLNRLTKSERHFRALIENGLDIILIQDSEARIQYASPSIQRIMGYRPSEIIGRSVLEYVHPDDVQTVIAQLSGTVEIPGISPVVGGRFKHRDGSWRYLQGASNNLLHDPVISGLIVNARDITEQKEAETALKHSEQKYRILFEFFPDGIATLNKESFLECNQKLLDLLGCTQEELIGRSVGSTPLSQQLAQGQSALALNQMVDKALEGAIISHEFSAVNRLGEAYSAELKLRRLDVEGQSYLDLILYDLTEKKRLEQVERARLAAESANRAKSEFLASVSHEIRTPMDAIIGLIRLLRQTGPTPTQENYLTRIQRSSRTLLGIINDILDFSKIEEGKLRLESVEFYLEEILDHILGMFAGKTGEKHLELITMSAEDVPGVLKGDPLRLEQVLINLVGNAVKFTDSGEIVVLIERVEQNQGIATLRFTVTDTGIGISEGATEHLFSPFTQAKGADHRGPSGTGLGLAICQRLVNLMQGEISIKSRVGVGSTFSFTAQFGFPAEEDRFEPEIPEVSGQRALVVHGNEHFQQMMQSRLKRFGIVAEKASEVHEAKEKLQTAAARKSPFDLAFIDNRLPDSAGITLAKEIEELPGLGQLRIVFTVCFGDEEIVLEQAGIPGACCLTKPVKQESLLQTLQLLYASGEDAPGIEARGGKDRFDPVSDLGGVNILLVEDNPVNQLIQREILESAGMRVEVAANGSQALARIRSKLPDLVLMDVQMPVLDGLSATRRIRSDPDFSGLPIIGMTAYTMKEELEQCLDVGMNEYIRKPVNPDRLLQLISKWVFPGPGIPEGAGKPFQDGGVVQDDEGESILRDAREVPVLDVRESLDRLGGKRDLLLKSLELFVRTYQDSATDIKRMLRDGERNKAAVYCHTLKGALSSISAKRLYRVVSALEKELRGEKPVSRIKGLDLLEEELKSFAQAVQHLEL